jgi:hypothetical protein
MMRCPDSNEVNEVDATSAILTCPDPDEADEINAPAFGGCPEPGEVDEVNSTGASTRGARPRSSVSPVMPPAAGEGSRNRFRPAMRT